MQDLTGSGIRRGDVSQRVFSAQGDDPEYQVSQTVALLPVQRSS
jgi:hypothetical protein